jgi:hypothetical protein
LDALDRRRLAGAVGTKDAEDLASVNLEVDPVDDANADPGRGIAEMARVARRGTMAVWDAIEASEGYSAMKQLFVEELGADAASSLDAPFAMGEAGVLERVVEEAGVAGVSYSRIHGSGRFSSIDEWVTTEVRGWTLGDSISDMQLADLVSAARERLGRFETPEGCVFPMAAKAATWSV